MKRFIYGFLLYVVASSMPAWGMVRGTTRVLTKARQLTLPAQRTLSSTTRLSFPKKNKELAPTTAHLLSLSEANLRENDPHRARPIYETIGAYKSDEKLMSMAKSLIRKEMRALKDSERYYTYYHAHQWPIDLAQRIYSELYPSKNKEFFPLYFLTLLHPPKNEQHLIDLLHEKGGGVEVDNEKYLLSVNAAFFGNLGQGASSTACYLTDNWSMNPPDLSPRALLKAFGHPELYNKYADEWKKVEALHAAASSHGKLWIIQIPKNVHSQIVIPAKIFGIKTKFIIDGKKTDDVDFIQETLRTRPQDIEDIDHMQFRILMTPSTGLNPNLGIKTIPANCADPEKYAAFEKEFHALMAKIKADTSSSWFSPLTAAYVALQKRMTSGFTSLSSSTASDKQQRLRKVTKEQFIEEIIASQLGRRPPNFAYADLTGIQPKWWKFDILNKLYDKGIRTDFEQVLRNANFEYANLTGLDLAHMNFSHTNFAHANLERADLEDTTFTNKANLDGANLEGTNLYRAENIDPLLSGHQKKQWKNTQMQRDKKFQERQQMYRKQWENKMGPVVEDVD